MKFRSSCFPWLAAVLLCATLAAQAVDAARVTYARSFQGSVPAFFQIEVHRDGAATYEVREKTGEPLARLAFTASPAAVQGIFAEADALQDFAGPRLQSSQRVAYTGDKMLAYDDAQHHFSQRFTYTTAKPAAALVNLFEGISVTGMDAIRLQRAMQYQPLDVLQIMNQIQSDWSSHQMAEPQLLVPTLQAIVANGNIMDAAQKRARRLLQEFRRKSR